MGLGLLLHLAALYNSYTFYFQNVSSLYLFVALIGYGLSYLGVALLIAHCLDDQYAILFINMLVLLVQFLLFPSHHMSDKISSSSAIYFYFGDNALFPALPNYSVAYLLAVVATLFYLAFDFWRHSMKFRSRVRGLCRCGRSPTLRHDSHFYYDESPVSHDDDQYLLNLEDISKRYGSFKALDGISFGIPRNQITCIVGKNGSGKTTLLHILSGFDSASSGCIHLRLDDNDV